MEINRGRYIAIHYREGGYRETNASRRKVGTGLGNEAIAGLRLNVMAFVSSFLGAVGSQHEVEGKCVRGDRPQKTVVRMNLDQGRRDVLKLAGLVSAGLILPSAAYASVNFDIDRYGDKEMKVSAINRVKQNLRSVLGENPSYLPYFIAMPTLDALSYESAGDTGGPDGALAFEMGREENAEMVEAFETLKAFAKRSREDVSLADYMAFAGAVAMEVVGGPRIVVQIGREDAEEKDSSGIYDKLTASANVKTIKESYTRAGRNGARDVVLFLATKETLRKIGDKRQSELAVPVEDDDPYAEDVFKSQGDLTYGQSGAGKKKRGAVLVDSQISSLRMAGSKFDNSYVKSLAEAKNKGSSDLTATEKELLADPECMTYITKYAGDKKAFIKDFAVEYEKLTLLGCRFEQAKIRDD